MLRHSLFLAAALFSVVLPGHATEQQDATATVLTISFPDAGMPNLDLSMAELMAMPVSSITTTTPWHDGEQRFEGVALSHLMEKVGASAETLRVEALNEYETELPFSDFSEHGPILAYRLNGKEMSVSDKGPLFIIYGFDDKPELNSELFFSRAAWQVRSMSVE